MKETHRTFTAFGWFFGIVFMPTGMFIGLATARVISWSKAIAWFALFFGLQICFARGMVHLETQKVPQLIIQLFLTTGMLTFGLSLLLIHHYGASEGYWNERDQKAWRILGRIGSFLALLSIISIMMQLVVIPLWIKPLMQPS